MFKSSELVEFCKKMVGMPYWYGTCGYKCSEDLLKRKANQYPTHYGSSRMPKYREAIQKKLVCVDCIGMLKAYFWTNGGQGIFDYLNGTGDFKNTYASNGMPDKSANGFLSWLKKKGCKYGKINTLPEQPGTPVFKDGHVGLYIGNGLVVEARGFNYGVVITKLKDRPWTDWAELPESLIDYEKSTAETPKKTSLGTRNLLVKSPYMSGNDVVELQTRLNALGYNCGKVDGEYGPKTKSAVKAFQRDNGLTVDGIFGKMSYAALMKHK